MSRIRFMLLGSSVLAASAVAAPAFAQGGSTADEVVVTGSLVVRNGNTAPTPVTVVDTASLQKIAPSNIPDGLNQLPQFSGSSSQTANAQSGTAIRPSSGNYLNLRNLGVLRSLILLDGQRVPPTSYEGSVDTNILPQAFVQRVDVVTAGASATYGSDAVSGVVNFVLDKRFTGLKGSVQGGISEQGDDNSEKMSLAAGHGFMDDRGHVLLSLEHYQSDGIKNKNDRPLWGQQAISYGNGTTIPRYTLLNAGTAQTTRGGVITSGPLRDQQFTPTGSLVPYNHGTSPALGGIEINSDGSVANGWLIGGLRTDQAFARASYDITDSITGFVQAAWGESRNHYEHNFYDNKFNNITIFSDNAFLTPAQRAVLQPTAASPVTSFTMSRQGEEQGGKRVDILNDSMTIFAGLEGSLGEWNWHANYSNATSILRAKHTHNPQNRNYYAAIDAVADASGNIVCRVTITNPGLYPGCVPLNILGANRASQAAIDYAFGTDTSYRAVNTMSDWAANISGPIFDLPAGPVSVALGGEYREQGLDMESNANPAIPTDFTGIRGVPGGLARFGNTNQGIAHGSFTVKEGFGEIQVPVLKDLPFFQSLDLNAAARYTEYSQAGAATTWKVGFSYQPVGDLRFRGTVSRDIRAPTLNELFAGQQASTNGFADLHTGITRSIPIITTGNGALAPEVGLTHSMGLIFQPSFLSGFSASLDYYHIAITNAITTPNQTTSNEDCERSNGTAPICSNIIRPLPFSDRSANNTPDRIFVQPINNAIVTTSGWDADVSYRFPLSGLIESSGAQMTVRAVGNYTPVYKTQQSATQPVVINAGVVAGQPKWRMLISAEYSDGPFSLSLQERYVGAMIRSNLSNAVFAEGFNDLDGVWYGSLSSSYKFKVAEKDMEAFFNVNNLFDKEPPLVPRTTEPGLQYPTEQAYYDVIGRFYTAGVRFRF
jgi:outer membrane receptor protein involved in Fe transport